MEGNQIASLLWTLTVAGLLEEEAVWVWGVMFRNGTNKPHIVDCQLSDVFSAPRAGKILDGVSGPWGISHAAGLFLL